MEDKTMKKIFTRLFAVSAIFAAFSCAELDAPTVSPEEGQTPETDPNGEYTTLTITPVATKSYLNGGELEWSANDFIYVFDDAGRRFKFTGEAKAAASFKFTYDNWPVGAEPVYAVFCPDGDPTWVSEGKFQMTHPDSQPIHNGNSFGKKANTSVAKIEKTQEGAYTAEFKNVCGLLKFVVATDYVKTVRIESIDGTPIAGDIVVNYNEGEPTYVMAEGGKKATSISVTPKANTSSTYYACLLPCDLDGIEVTVTNINGRSMSLSGSVLMTIERGKHVNLGTLDQRTVYLKFYEQNLYGLPETDTTGENSYSAKDNLGLPVSFGIGFGYNYKYDTNKDYCLKFLRQDSSGKEKYGYIKTPVYEDYYLSAASLNVRNTSSKNFRFYADAPVDAYTQPKIPVSNQKSADSDAADPAKVTPTWTFKEGETSLGYLLPGVPYYLTCDSSYAYMDDVTFTYSFTSAGPDASETPETPVE